MWTDEYDDIQRYFICMYYCVLILGGNELGPQKIEELYYIVFANILGAIVNAQIFGELAVLLSQLNRQEAYYQAIIDLTNTTMENIRLPITLR